VVGGVFLLACVAAYLHRRKPKEEMVQSFGARLGTAQTFSNPAYANQRDGELEGVLGGLAAAIDDGELYDVQDGVGGAGDENYEDPDQATYEDPDAPAAKTAAKPKRASYLTPSAGGGDQPNYEDIDEAQADYEEIPNVRQGATSYDYDDSSDDEDLDDTYNTVTEFVAAKTSQPSRTGSVHAKESAESLYLSQAVVATTAETSLSQPAGDDTGYLTLSQPAGVDTGHLTLGGNNTNSKPYEYGSSSEEEI